MSYYFDPSLVSVSTAGSAYPLYNWVVADSNNTTYNPSVGLTFNTGSPSSGKFNWYIVYNNASVQNFPAAMTVTNGTTIGSLGQNTLTVNYNLTGASTPSDIFVNIYTVHQGDGHDRASWYRSVITYSSSTPLQSGNGVLTFHLSDPSLNAISNKFAVDLSHALVEPILYITLQSSSTNADVFTFTALSYNLSSNIEAVFLNTTGSDLSANYVSTSNPAFITAGSAPAIVANPYNTPSMAANTITPYSGFVYGIPADGGFSTTQWFNQVNLGTESQIYRYDVTNAVQIAVDVSMVNAKLGIVKSYNPSPTAANTYSIVSSSYDPDTNKFDVRPPSGTANTLVIQASDFINGLNPSRVLQVGKLSTLYSDFDTYVQSYFGYVGGFESLFSNPVDFSANSTNFGLFDASALVHLLADGSLNAATVTSTVAGIDVLSGELVINNVDQFLRTAVDSNCFGNRDASSNDTLKWASDPSNNSNYGLSDGFLPGDVIIVQNGLTVTLNVVIAPEVYNTPLNNIGLAQSTGTAAAATTNFNSVTGSGGDKVGVIYNQQSAASTSLITTTVKVPLMLKLERLS